VLTIGETPEYLDAGGIVSLSMREEAIQFDVNLVAANKAHLKISSRLLALARHVVNQTEAAKSLHVRPPDSRAFSPPAFADPIRSRHASIGWHEAIYLQKRLPLETAVRREEQLMKESEESLNLTFNQGELLARVDNDREILRDLLVIFKEEFPGHLQALREAVDSGDAKLVVVAAHTLKGMLLNMAAGQAADAASRLEQMGRSGEVSKFQDALAAFERDAARLLPHLDACMAEVHR
jgi:HPt (histidine-containing phosphotransfer) domain-containing protein